MKKSMKKNTVKSLRTIEDDFFLLGTILAAAFLSLAAILALYPNVFCHFKMPPCLFHLFSGYYCPGCGGTRAVHALLHGHVLQAAYFHPFVPYAAAVYFYFMITQIIERISRGRFAIGMRYQNCWVWIAVGLIIGNFLMKNTLHYFFGFIL